MHIYPPPVAARSDKTPPPRARATTQATSTASLLCELHVPKFKAPDDGVAALGGDKSAVAGLPAAATDAASSAAYGGALPEAMPAPSALDAIDAMGSPEEMRRERARLHAKHTRDRKKVFVRTIEQTISELEVGPTNVFSRARARSVNNRLT